MKFTTALLIVVAMAIAIVSAAPVSEEQYQYLFTKWVQHYNKSYETNDMFTRYTNFKDQVNFVVGHNAKKSTWTAGLNQYSDLTEEEFNQVLGLKTSLSNNVVTSEQTAFDDLVSQFQSAPKSNKVGAGYISWEASFPPVKDQGSCGSCWSFGAVGLVEAMYKETYGDSVVLSEQQLVDCDKVDSGCSGGLPKYALAYLQKEGVCLQSDYPYTGRNGVCQTGCNKVVRVGEVATVVDTPGSNIENHVAAIQNGPINIGIDASNPAFRNFQKGVVKASECTKVGLNHSVIIVAYGVDAQTGLEFWKIRNSWATSWGDNGHIYVEAVRGTCGVGTGQENRQALTVEKM